MVNSIKVVNIFNTMSFGESLDDTQMAITWLAHNFPKSDTTSIVQAKHLRTQEIVAWLPKCVHVQGQQKTWRNISEQYRAITAQLKSNRELFVQLEIVLQGYSRQDAEREFRMFISYLEYVAGSRKCPDLNVDLQQWNSLWLLGYHLTQQRLICSEENAFLRCLQKILLPVCNEHNISVLCVDCVESSSLRKSSAIVFGDADLDSACSELLNAAFAQQGIMPWCVRTVFVQEDIFPTFVNRMQRTLASTRLGHAGDRQADFTYPHLAGCFEKQFAAISTEAMRKGIEIYSPPANVDDRPYKFEMTLFIGGKLHESVNIPFLNILAVRSTKEAIALTHHEANLFGVSVWTSNLALANEVSLNLKVRAVWINCQSIIHPEMQPFHCEMPVVPLTLSTFERVQKLQAVGEELTLKLLATAEIKQWAELLLSSRRFVAKGSKVMLFEGHEIKQFPQSSSQLECSNLAVWRKQIVVSLVLGYQICKPKNIEADDDNVLKMLGTSLGGEIFAAPSSLPKCRIYKYVYSPTCDTFC